MEVWYTEEEADDEEVAKVKRDTAKWKVELNYHTPLTMPRWPNGKFILKTDLRHNPSMGESGRHWRRSMHGHVACPCIVAGMQVCFIKVFAVT